MLRLFLLCLLFCSHALAQQWPVKPVKLVVPFSPGGFADSAARAISERLAARLGQPVLIENKVGASGNIGGEMVAKSAPDGYTLLLAFDGAMVINPHVFAKMPFDTLRDFAPVTKLGDAPVIVVAHPSVPVKDLRELIALAKAKPGTLSYGTSGTGGTPHLVGEMINQRAGKLKALGVTSKARVAALPDVPTFGESGLPDFVVNSWVGILAPANTPRPVVDRLQRDIAAVLKEPEVRERFAVLGNEPVGNSPDEYGAQIRTDFAQWGAIVKRAGIRIE